MHVKIISTLLFNRSLITIKENLKILNMEGLFVLRKKMAAFFSFNHRVDKTRKRGGGVLNYNVMNMQPGSSEINEGRQKARWYKTVE